jgi:hypothetical protein
MKVLRLKKFGKCNCSNIKMMLKILLIKPNKNLRWRRPLTKSLKNGKK